MEKLENAFLKQEGVLITKKANLSIGAKDSDKLPLQCRQNLLAHFLLQASFCHYPRKATKKNPCWTMERNPQHSPQAAGLSE